MASGKKVSSRRRAPRLSASLTSVRLPSEGIHRMSRRLQDTGRRLPDLARRAKRLFSRSRPAPRRAAQPPVRHRPDGSVITIAPPVAAGRSSNHGGGSGLPFQALGRHWRHAMLEGKLAAREKEAEIRADYERRVAHDAHWHAQQRNRKQGG